MKSLLFFLTLVISTILAQDLSANLNTQDVNLKQVRCLVCRTTIDVFEDEVSKIDPTKEIEIGQYKLDYKGNAHQKKVPMAMSEIHLSEMLDSICKTMDDYVRARNRSDGKLILIRLMTDAGLNPKLSEVEIVQDGDLNKSLGHFCSAVVNENEDEIISMISQKEEHAKIKICTKYCEGFEDELDLSDDDETINESSEDKDIKTEL